VAFYEGSQRKFKFSNGLETCLLDIDTVEVSVKLQDHGKVVWKPYLYVAPGQFDLLNWVKTTPRKKTFSYPPLSAPSITVLFQNLNRQYWIRRNRYQLQRWYRLDRSPTTAGVKEHAAHGPISKDDIGHSKLFTHCAARPKPREDSPQPK
jgi:hypothetical protein